MKCVRVVDESGAQTKRRTSGVGRRRQTKRNGPRSLQPASGGGAPRKRARSKPIFARAGSDARANYNKAPGRRSSISETNLSGPKGLQAGRRTSGWAGGCLTCLHLPLAGAGPPGPRAALMENLNQPGQEPLVGAHWPMSASKSAWPLGAYACVVLADSQELQPDLQAAPVPLKSGPKNNRPLG